MADKEKFIEAINAGYTHKGDSIILGAGILDGAPVEGLQIKAPLKMMNRHGLIAGATGTGKTKTMQGIAESLSAKGIPCLLMDVKGDLSGLAQEGAINTKIEERSKSIGIKWKQHAFPVEIYSISNDAGVRMRATVSEFGPVLFSKILDLNDTQAGVVSLVFKYSDDKQMPLLDLKDFKKVLQFLTNEAKAEIKGDYGAISTASASTILRKIIEVEQQGAEQFFGERSFEVEDLIRIDNQGYGYLSIVRLTDMQSKPKLFSTFMLSLMAEIYATFPEIGDADAPKLCVFIDEAHLIFDTASKALLDQLETMIKLIRSKGVGIYFVTQLPTDIPAAILSQLGMKVQHALRAFTANDRKAIKLTADNYPLTEYYNTEELLTSLGTGEALITVLNEKGNPTPLAHTLLCPPRSRMDILTPEELNTLVSKSNVVKKYNEVIDSKSAHEILTDKLAAHIEETAEEDSAKEQKKENDEPGMIEKAVTSSAGKQVMRTAASIITRSLLGAIGIKSTTRRKKKSGWF
ncbi:MAG: DUF853 family protein [Bacteroidetes bacterium]|nr:DUF853 family protein [Bacteroidota bacterium]